MHKKTLEAVQQSDNHLLVQLKRNQPTLYDRMAQYMQDKPADDCHRLHDSGKRNRIESREASIWLLKPNEEEAHWADTFETLISIHRQVDRFNTQQKNWVRSEETAYYLCDLALSAEKANQAIRNHWGIENKIHHVRDTRLDEDRSRVRCNPSIFAILRSFALNIFRFNKVGNISLALYDNTLEFDNILAYKGL